MSTTTPDGKIINRDTGELTWGVELRTPYNFDRMESSIATALTCEDESRTQQQFLEDADVNVIMERFGVTGELPQNVQLPSYTEYVEVFDFQTAQNAIRAGQEAFAEMPAKVRERFQNDPGRFIAFFNDEQNRAEGERLGLLIAKPAPEPTPGPAPGPAPGPGEG